MRIRLAFFACLLVLAGGGLSQAAVRVAVLEGSPSQSNPIVALVLPKLTASDKFTVVERQQIAKVLGEQQLSVLSGSNAMAGRISIGKLLQADLLVFVQPVQGPQARLEVSISDTHHGLRLVRQAVDPASGENAAAAIYKLIEEAATRQAQKIDEIFAVPPFASDDLGFEFDYLKGAYARLIEGVLYEQKGVLVADLDEARAIAQEITLSSAADVTRSLPLYVLGSFRNDGKKNDRRVRITLKLMRGEAMVSSITKEDLTPDEVPAMLREATASFLAKSKTAPQPAPDPRIEAAQLAARARTMKTLGSWRDSLDLIEASLLLDSDQPLLQIDAVEVLTKFTGEQGVFAAEAPVEGRPVDVARANAYLQGLAHLESYLRAVKLDRNQNREAEVIFRFTISLDRWGEEILRNRFLQGNVSLAAGRMDPATLDLLREKFLNGSVGPYWDDYIAARRASTDMFFRVLQDKSHRKIADDALWFIEPFDNWGVGMYLPDGFTWYSEFDPIKLGERHVKLLADFAFLPNEADFLARLMVYPGQHQKDPRNDTVHLPGYAEFLRKARETPNEGVRQKADALLAAIERTPVRRAPTDAEDAATVKAFVKPPPPKADPNDDVRLTPLKLSIEGAIGEPSPLPILGWMPAGKGIDVVWNRQELFVMKQPGVLQRFSGLHGKTAIDPFNRLQVRFDGQYVWAVYFSIGRTRLLVLDPEHGTVVSLDAAEELPASSQMAVTALGPGRAAILGYFGQTFAATVEVKADAKPRTKILHEFRHAPKTSDAEQWHDADMSFRPQVLLTLSDPVKSGPAGAGAAKQSLLAWRFCDQQRIIEHPIVIDVASGETRVLDQRFLFYYPDRMLAHDGVVDQVDVDQGTDVVHRVALSGVTTRDFGLRVTNVRSVFEYGGALHCVDTRWLIGGMDAGPFRPIKVTFPRAVGGPTVCRSEHYGLVAWVNVRQNQFYDQDYNVYRVDFANPIADLLKKQ